jgi:HPr kinase/phosphorylase
MPTRHATLDLPQVAIDGAAASAPERVALALDVALGRVTQRVGAFVA